MEENYRIEQLEPKITETKLWNSSNIFLAFIVGVGFAILAAVLIITLDLNIVDSLILVLVIVVVYASILFFLLESKVLREVEQTTIKTVDRPYIKEVPVEKKVFVDRQVEKRVFVDRPVIKEVQVEKKVFVDRPVEKEVSVHKEVIVEKPVVSKVYVHLGGHRDTVSTPRYNFVASTETTVYHKINCRFGKLIKKKYKLLSNLERDFIRKGFRPCKVCLKKKA
jgi:phosphate/sulfate permease